MVHETSMSVSLSNPWILPNLESFGAFMMATIFVDADPWKSEQVRSVTTTTTVGVALHTT